MFKLIALVTFMLNGNVMGTDTLTYTQRFPSQEACEALRTGEVGVSAEASLRSSIEARLVDGATITIETKCVPTE